MKTINARSILDPLSNKEMKNVTGGNDPNSLMMGGDGGGSGTGGRPCWWKESTAIPCLLNWSGICSESCDEFFNSFCVKGAYYSGCQD